MARLSSKNLSVQLNKTYVLNEVSVTFGPGELVGIIGPNGAGKTTLLRSLLGLLKPTVGEITLDAKALQAWTRKDVAQRISYLAQGAPCHWPMTVQRIVEIGRSPHSLALWGLDSVDREIVIEALRLTGTLHLRDRIVTTLSGGERTLVMIARCLAGRAQILLADEPVTGLDPRHQIQVIKTLLNSVNKNTGVVMVLHDLSLAARYCTRLILMNEGRVVLEGSPTSVLTPNNLSNVYGIDASLRTVDGQTLVLCKDVEI